MEDFEEKFLCHDSLRDYLLYACHSNAESSDPITDALTVMLTEPVQYTISKHGLIMFKSLPPLPFTHMNPGQRQLIYNVASSIRCEYPTYSYFALAENPLTYSVENERITLNIQSQKLDPKLVLLVLVELISTSTHQSQLLFNIMIQRLSARVLITKDAITFANDQCRRAFTSSEATEPAQAPPR